MSHGPRFAWLESERGHFTDGDATCVLDLESTCHTGGWCFGSLFGNWRVDYAPRIDFDRMLGHRWGGTNVGPFCDASYREK
jgi:hypothetical protein